MMAIREDVVASAAKFLQDPSVASSPPENQISFLRAKNLTPDEINAALARARVDGVVPTTAPGVAGGPPPFAMAPQPSTQPPYPGYAPPYGWQQPQQPPPVLRRDWRDWFIVATVVGGVSYGLYSMTKASDDGMAARYIYPLVAPPTPDRLDRDKKAIDEQFERAFALVEQLAKDTDALKAAEKERTERLDQALGSLETAIADLQAASKRREDDTERLRDDVRGLKDALPKAMETQRNVTDSRLREVNAELKGLRTLVGQRMGSNGAPLSAANVNGSTPSYLRPSGAPAATAPSVASTSESEPMAAASVAVPENTSSQTATLSDAAGASSAFSTTGKASIPAWQRAMTKPTVATSNGSSSSSTGQPEANGSA